MATDFRGGHAFPRRGRNEYVGYLWLLRVFDKARAFRNGTIDDYIYPCPIDRAIFERWGITSQAFDEALATCSTDDEILRWLTERVGDDRRDAANRYLLEERMSNLQQQDAEEGVATV